MTWRLHPGAPSVSWGLKLRIWEGHVSRVCDSQSLSDIMESAGSVATSTWKTKTDEGTNARTPDNGRHVQKHFQDKKIQFNPFMTHQIHVSTCWVMLRPGFCGRPRRHPNAVGQHFFCKQISVQAEIPWPFYCIRQLRKLGVLCKRGIMGIGTT